MIKYTTDERFIKVKDLKEALKLAPDDAYIALYDGEAEEDTFLQKVTIQPAGEGTGYCQGGSLVDEAIEEGHLNSTDVIVVLSGDKLCM